MTRTTSKKSTTTPVSKKKTARKKTSRQKTTGKKTVRKTTTRKKVTKKTTKKKVVKKPVSLKKEAVIQPEQQAIEQPQIKLVPIYNTDPQTETRKQIFLIVITVFIALVVLGWIWSIKQKINNVQDSGLPEFAWRQDVDNTLQDVNSILKNTSQVIEELNQELTNQEYLEQTKQQILNDLQNKLQTEHWPEHTSEVMGIKLQYPDTWSKQEQDNRLDLVSYASSSTPDYYASLNITKHNNKQSSDMLAWVKQNLDLTDKVISQDFGQIDNQPTLWYINSEPTDSKLDWLILVEANNSIYQIQIQTAAGQQFYQPVFDKIINSVKFL